METNTAKTEQQAESAKPDFGFGDFYDHCVWLHGEFEAMQILEAVELAADAERRGRLMLSRQDRDARGDGLSQ